MHGFLSGEPRVQLQPNSDECSAEARRLVHHFTHERANKQQHAGQQAATWRHWDNPIRWVAKPASGLLHEPNEHAGKSQVVSNGYPRGYGNDASTDAASSLVRYTILTSTLSLSVWLVSSLTGLDSSEQKICCNLYLVKPLNSNQSNRRPAAV